MLGIGDEHIRTRYATHRLGLLQIFPLQLTQLRLDQGIAFAAFDLFLELAAAHHHLLAELPARVGNVEQRHDEHRERHSKQHRRAGRRQPLRLNAAGSLTASAGNPGMTLAKKARTGWRRRTRAGEPSLKASNSIFLLKTRLKPATGLMRSNFGLSGTKEKIGPVCSRFDSTAQMMPIAANGTTMPRNALEELRHPRSRRFGTIHHEVGQKQRTARSRVPRDLFTVLPPTAIKPSSRAQTIAKEFRSRLFGNLSLLLRLGELVGRPRVQTGSVPVRPCQRPWTTASQ